MRLPRKLKKKYKKQKELYNLHWLVSAFKMWEGKAYSGELAKLVDKHGLKLTEI